MRKWLLWIGLIVLARVLSAQTVTVSGSVVNPDGSPFKGTFIITLAKSTVVNICTTPNLVVPSYMSIPVNGTFPSTAIYATPCLSPRLPYFVRVVDQFNQSVYSDNWYIPLTLSGTVNVGSLGDVKLASGITVAVPLAIISNPSGNQVITQPPGTSLTINNLIVGGTSPIVQSVIACGTTTTCANTGQTLPRIVWGTVTLSGGTALVGSMPAWTSTASFACTPNDLTTAGAAKITNTSATSITVTGGTSDVVNYVCVGN